MGYVLEFDETLQQTDPVAVIRDGKEILLQAFNWESHKHDWWRNLDSKVSDIAESGFTSAWLPPPSNSFAPEGYLPQNLYSLNSKYGSESMLKALLHKMRQHKVRPMADIVINHRVGTTQGHGGRYNRYDGIPLSWDEHAVTSCTGGLVLVTAVVVGMITHFVAGQAGPAALVIGNGLALSSTAVVLQIDHSALETLLGGKWLQTEVMLKHHSVVADRASHAVDEQAEESLVIKDVGHAFSNEDTGHAMTTASQPSRFQSMKSIPQQEVKDRTMVSYTLSAQKVKLLEDVTGIEDDSTNIHFVRKRSIGDTSESEKECEKDMSIENLSKHFGRPLGDAAKSFGVSRSTFKRICRGLGIERWQYGKRRMKSHSSPKLNRVNDEGRSIQKFSHLSMPALQVSTAAQTSQGINVKATAAIRFELLDSSGIAELEDNVIERLKIKRDTFSIKYQDDEGDWVLIACDKDVRKCIEISRSLKKTTVKMLVDRPISHYAS